MLIAMLFRVGTNTDSIQVRGRLTSCVTRGFVLVLFVGGLMQASSEVVASCGDYLYRNGRPVMLHSPAENRSVPGNAAHAFDIDQQDASESTPIPVRPCSGPNCSGRPAAPFPATPIPVSLKSTVQLDGVLAAHGESAQVVGLRKPPESERGEFFQSLPAFRPPRAS